MAQKKTLMFILISLAFSLVVLQTSVVMAKSIRLVAAHVTPVDSPYTPGFETFKKMVEEETNGAIKVSIHPAGELGGNEDILTQKLHTGTVDVIITSPGFLAQVVKEADIFSLLYLFKDFGHWQRVLDGSIGEKVAEVVENKTDFKFLGYWSCGVRHYFGNRAVKIPADLDGVKIRVHTSPITRDTWMTLGAQPTNVAISELYQALQNKVVDAAENSVLYIYKMKFIEVSRYVSLTGHSYGVRFLLMNDRKFKKFSDREKLIVEKAGLEATRAEREADFLDQKKYMNILLKAGTKINTVDKDAFIKKTSPIRERAVKKLGMEDMLAQIANLAE